MLAKYKEQDGVLRVNADVLEFTEKEGTKPSLSILLSSVIAQAKSDKKGTAIRITTSDGGETVSNKNYIFTFNGGNDLEDRKNLIKILSETIKTNKNAQNHEHVQNNRGVVSGLTEADIENRLYLLLQKKELSVLHRDLVQSGLIPESEFWEDRKVNIGGEFTAAKE